MAGGELIEFSLVGGALAAAEATESTDLAWAAAGASSASPIGTTGPHRRACENKRTTSSVEAGSLRGPRPIHHDKRKPKHLRAKVQREGTKADTL